MKVMYECKTCGQQAAKPNRAHVIDHLSAMMKDVQEGKVPSAQFYELRITEEWE